jgi:ABC-type transport system substrate-binding protein
MPDPATYRPQELADMPRNAEHFMGWSHNPRPIEMIRARPILETTTRVNALLRGDIDATGSYLPFDNVTFRRCLSMAFNYRGFISGILKDYAVRNGGPIPKNLWGRRPTGRAIRSTSNRHARPATRPAPRGRPSTARSRSTSRASSRRPPRRPNCSSPTCGGSASP